MRRIYFMVPDIGSAKNIVDELLLARIEARHIHVLAKRGTPMEDLPQATYLQKTDFIPALQQGMAVGGLTGAVVGLVALALPAGPALTSGAWLISTLTAAGAGVGALLSSMVGISIGNRRFKQFEAAMEKGEFLMMLDIPTKRVGEIETAIKKHHPSAAFGGTEPNIPAFP